jgi:hypothetical protein
VTTSEDLDSDSISIALEMENKRKRQAEIQERQREQFLGTRLEFIKSHMNRCPFCHQYFVLEKFDSLSLSSTALYAIKEVFQHEIEGIENDEHLCYHVAAHHEKQTSDAIKLYQRVTDYWGKLKGLDYFNYEYERAASEEEKSKYYYKIKNLAEELSETYRNDESDQFRKIIDNRLAERKKHDQDMAQRGLRKVWSPMKGDYDYVTREALLVS